MTTAPPKYLVDVCSMNEVDGAHGDGHPSVSMPVDQVRIWTGLLALFEEGRVRMVGHAKTDLRQWNEEAYAKVRPNVAVRETNAVVTIYREVNRQFPGWVDEDADPADPWMVAYATAQGWDIVTEEKRIAEQRIKGKRPKIPEAADAFGVKCLKIADFIRDEGWL